MLFFDNFSYLETRLLNKKIKELESNIDFYREESKKDSIEINYLKDIDHLEAYARKKYYMKRKDEEVYVIEFEQ